MLKEFREFALRGSVLDMAIGIIIGAAFGKLVTLFVSEVLMPPVGLIIGKVDFSNLYINLSGKEYETLAAAKSAGAATINYGLFLNGVIDFIIVAFVVFLIVRYINRLKRPEPAPILPETKECRFCLSAVPVKAVRCPHCTSEI